MAKMAKMAKMVSLTHVSMCSDHEWIRISARKAAALHPDGGVSGRSGLFRCDLCHQHVTFVNKEKNTPHFRHSSKEADKSCLDRVSDTSSLLDYKSGYYKVFGYSLPLRIMITQSAYHFELGFPSIPTDNLDEMNSFKVSIQIDEKNVRMYNYPERFQANGITWLDVGNIPSSAYKINTPCINSTSLSYWPGHVRGIDLKGTVFDADTGRMLFYGADVQVNKEYLILQSEPLTDVPKSIQQHEIVCKKMNTQAWRLYQIKASDFSESAAEFFMNYRCRLIETPSIQVLWPVYTKDPYIIRHNQDFLWLYVRKRNIKVTSFPFADQEEFPSNQGIVYLLPAYRRQQVLAIGNSEISQNTNLWQEIQDVYLWHDSLNKIREIPSVSVKDLAGEAIQSGVSCQLPYGNILRIHSKDCNGTISILQRGLLLGRYSLKAGEEFEVSSVHFGMEVQVSLGLDCVWAVLFQRKQEDSQLSDYALAQQLEHGGGKLRPVPHSLGWIMKKLDKYPKVRRWLYRKIREGTMPENSYRLLRHLIVVGEIT